MNYRSFALCAAVLGGLLSPSLPAAQAQPVSTQRVGVTGKELATVKLGTDFDIGKGRTLRMREVTIAPGGLLPMHSHADRPSVSYVLQGTLVEYVEGETTGKQIAAGQSYSTQGPKSHALENKAQVPAIFIEIDLPGNE